VDYLGPPVRVTATTGGPGQLLGSVGDAIITPGEAMMAPSVKDPRQLTRAF
jgi:hypothetical protein